MVSPILNKIICFKISKSILVATFFKILLYKIPVNFFCQLRAWRSSCCYQKNNNNSNHLQAGPILIYKERSFFNYVKTNITQRPKTFRQQ